MALPIRSGDRTQHLSIDYFLLTIDYLSREMAALPISWGELLIIDAIRNTQYAIRDTLNAIRCTLSELRYPLHAARNCILKD